MEVALSESAQHRQFLTACRTGDLETLRWGLFEYVDLGYDGDLTRWYLLCQSTMVRGLALAVELSTPAARLLCQLESFQSILEGWIRDSLGMDDLDLILSYLEIYDFRTTLKLDNRCFTGSEETSLWLLQNCRMNMHSQRIAILDTLCSQGKLEAFKYMMENSIPDRHIRSKKRGRLMSDAVGGNHVEMVRWMLESGFIKKRKNIEGGFLTSCRYGYSEMVRTFLEHGVSNTIVMELYLANQVSDPSEEESASDYSDSEDRVMVLNQDVLDVIRLHIASKTKKSARAVSE